MCSCVCMLMGINLRWKYAGNFLTYKYKRWSASKSIKTHFFYLPFFFISISFLFFSDSLWFVKTFPFSCALNVWSTSYCQWASSCLLIRRQTEKKTFSKSFHIKTLFKFIQTLLRFRSTHHIVNMCRQTRICTKNKCSIEERIEIGFDINNRYRMNRSLI